MTIKQCPACGHERNNTDIRCPECGRFYSKVLELIEEESVNEEKSTLRGRCKRVLKSGNIKQAILAEFKSTIAGLSKKALFTLFVIFVFVFALVITVL